MRKRINMFVVILLFVSVFAGCNKTMNRTVFVGEKSGATYTLADDIHPMYQNICLIARPLSDKTVQTLYNELGVEEKDIFDIEPSDEIGLYSLYFSRQDPPDHYSVEENSFLPVSEMTEENVKFKAKEFLEKVGITPEGEYALIAEPGDSQRYCIVTYCPTCEGVPLLYAPKIEISFSSRQIEGFVYSWAVVEEKGQPYPTEAVSSPEKAIPLFERHLEENHMDFSNPLAPIGRITQAYHIEYPSPDRPSEPAQILLHPIWVFSRNSIIDSGNLLVDMITGEIE